jgi:heptaprenylglyceryl phosphate synthase
MRVANRADMLFGGGVREPTRAAEPIHHSDFLVVSHTQHNNAFFAS